MVYVVRKSDKKILFREDAWAYHSVEAAYTYVAMQGLETVDEEITAMGDMVIWVI